MRAQQLLNHLDGMAALEERIQALKDPFHFRLDASQLPAAPKWARSVAWTTRDDAMLLLGVYFYGLGNWGKMAADDRLQLASKLQSSICDNGMVANHNGNVMQPKGDWTCAAVFFVGLFGLFPLFFGCVFDILLHASFGVLFVEINRSALA